MIRMNPVCDFCLPGHTFTWLIKQLYNNPEILISVQLDRKWFAWVWTSLVHWVHMYTRKRPCLPWLHCEYIRWWRQYFTTRLSLQKGGPFPERFSHRNPISMKIQSVHQVVMGWSLWNFAHGTTAVLSWHVQNYVEIWYSTMELH